MKRKLKKPSLSERVIALIESARQKVAYTANLAQVYTNYEIGRQIVEEEQGGKRRAGYGEKIIEELSAKLTARYGKGWGTSNLEYMRRFFLTYSTVQISQTVSGKLLEERKSATQLRKSESANSVNSVYQIPQFTLSWSHYFDRVMKIPDENPTIGILLTSKKVDQPLVEMFLPEGSKDRIFVKQYTDVMPSKLALKRIVAEEKRKYEKEKLLALAASKKGAK